MCAFPSPCSVLAAGSPIGVPRSALQRGGRAHARFRRPQRAPHFGGSRRGGEADCCVGSRRPCSVVAAGSPIGVPRSTLQRGGRAHARFRRPQRAPRLGGSPLGGEAACSVSGRRPCSVLAAGSPIGVPRSTLQRGGRAHARFRRPPRALTTRGVTARRRDCLLREWSSLLL